MLRRSVATLLTCTMLVFSTPVRAQAPAPEQEATTSVVFESESPESRARIALSRSHALVFARGDQELPLGKAALADVRLSRGAKTAIIVGAIVVGVLIIVGVLAVGHHGKPL